MAPNSLSQLRNGLQALRVTHWAANAAASAQQSDLYAQADAGWVPGAFYLGTCQRKIWVSAHAAAPIHDPNAPSSAAAPSIEALRGAEAYRLLLRIATGLASQVRGESDIFGQLKEAWNQFTQSTSAEAAALHPWITRLFEDTKEIRANHLQSTGGDSYGSLVRKMLKKVSGGESSEIAQPILLVGAGQIAQSIAPWLAQQELWIINRSAPAAHALKQELVARHAARVRVLETPAERHDGWTHAAHAVVCVPPLPEQDSEWVRLWTQPQTQAIAPTRSPRALIHLGGTHAELPAWKAVSEFFSLDDLFALQREQNLAREELFQRAEKACEQKATLRSLSGSSTRSGQGSASLPHGWEDLALFA